MFPPYFCASAFFLTALLSFQIFPYPLPHTPVPFERMNLESSCFLSSGLDSPFSSYCLLPDMLPECRILKCRCGSVGDGDDMRRLIDVQGETVQCEVCEQFSHIACQPDDVNNGPYFICHECNLGDYFKYHTPQAAQRSVH